MDGDCGAGEGGGAIVALLNPPFLRAHPVTSGMIWATPLCAGTLLGNWLFGEVSAVSVSLIVPIWVSGGLAWGYAMKTYYDREASR
jgi:hypothetical protein